ncbi:unnamed protein product [Clonostachys chloroleuca]|uniref:Glucose-methanol-choline oxidoreductase N-terminal domain-containing protein n=1 Tax=Clonostachys chloroleuca TaxID=1926264 RepID=A0AA35QFU9_9HYPO|nr:unnamed protein product [Clonostachys chloroleuca]
MKASTFLSGLIALVAPAMAQSTTSYVDPKTSITFQQFSDSKTGYTFGIALPKNPTTDFIGQISAPITEGYAAASMSSSMANSYLIVAFPSGESVSASIRLATGYTNPSVITDSGIQLKEIPSGTFVNATSFTYTFLCSGCISGDKAFDPTTETGVMGWALSTTALTDTSSASATLNYHGAGFGGFGVKLTEAQSADYDTWAKLATGTTPTNPGGDTPTNPGNFTTVISNVTYDYIVAGAGAAGIIAAERLAESGASVLLLERGKESLYSSGGRSVMDWNDTTTQYDVPSMAYYLSTAADTTEYCTDTASQAGCILGGGTVVNAMMFVRPRAADFDDKWPSGWKWADGVETAAGRLYERTPGTIMASKDGQRYDQGAWDVLSKWLSGIGFSEVNTLEEPEKKHAVYSRPPWMINNGLRAGPVRDYLPLAKALPNFTLQLNSKMLRVIRNGTAATGVEVETSSTTRQIINLKTGGAVVLASGSLSTPRILFNSGIGPVAQIQTVSNGTTKITLPPQADWIELPVGQNLQDHPIYTVSFKTKQPLQALNSSSFTKPSQTDIDLFAQGSGLLAQSGQRLNFWTTVEGSDGITRSIQGTCNSPSSDTVRMKIYLTHGLTSKGSLAITSSGATTFSKDPYLNTAEDREAVLGFMQQLIDYSGKANSTISLASNVTAESLIKDLSPGAHFIGTAKMGSSNDGESVVDTDTKVWGMDNLFVVDASMHPDLPTGNTQAIVMVAAEYAVEKILASEKGTGNGTGNGNGSTPTPIPVTTTASATTPTATTTSTARPSCKSKRRVKKRALKWSEIDGLKI